MTGGDRGPGRVPVITWVIGQVINSGSIRIHYENILIPIPIRYESDLPVIGRPAGHCIVRRMVSDLNLLICIQVEDKYVIIAIHKFCESQETAIVRPGRVGVRNGFTG